MDPNNQETHSNLFETPRRTSQPIPIPEPPRKNQKIQSTGNVHREPKPQACRRLTYL